MTKTTKLATILYLLSSLLLITPSPAHAQLLRDWTTNSFCHSDTNPAVFDGVATIRGVECIVYNALTVAITLIGIGVLAMFIIGAFKLLTSGGDPKAVEAGKNTLTYAVIGLVVAISAWFIINLIANFTGAQQIKTFSTQIDNTSN